MGYSPADEAFSGRRSYEGSAVLQYSTTLSTPGSHVSPGVDVFFFAIVLQGFYETTVVLIKLTL